MQTTLLIVAALILATIGAYRIVRNIVRIRRAEQVRNTRLRELAADPSIDIRVAPEQLATDLDRNVARAAREDFVLTGVLLAAMGITAVFAGREIGYGSWAVGLYTAGLCGIVGGVALSLLGGVLRIVLRPLASPTRPDRST